MPVLNFAIEEIGSNLPATTGIPVGTQIIATLTQEGETWHVSVVRADGVPLTQDQINLIIAALQFALAWSMKPIYPSQPSGLKNKR